MDNNNKHIGIIDYGMGNIGSISNMLKFIGNDSEIITNSKNIDRFDHLILPGVGNFDSAIKALKRKDLFNVIQEISLNPKKSILGICLGMQLLCESSEEGDMEGLGLIKIKFKKFKFTLDSKYKIPHMGWNNVDFRNMPSFSNIFQSTPRFYFVHSYFGESTDSDIEFATSKYALEFISAYKKGNLIGVQFHPEKSHSYGIHFFQKYLTLL